MDDAQAELNPTLDALGESLLAGLSSLLDSLIDAAALAQPGSDADLRATEMRYSALQLESLGSLLAAASLLPQPAAEPLRIPA